ncbi:efflux RND transporter periplasmic adaptor subunit [Pseudoalteromonas fenneropenaei]|uniref:Efflux RND transporter periplasmic adaptor subunit n=1 Tax=Pseudoalteromonas fenneropenaei TaxID=1737459 RepID=A0ABV7CPL6_9GAMM
MASRKQILFPVAVLAIGIAAAAGFAAMKAPPQEKVEEVIHPLVEASPLHLAPMTLDVSSYGVVQPKYHTQLVAQVAGQVVELSEQFVKGGFVKEGQVLARIDPNDYEAALIEAEANLAQASSGLEIERAQAQVAQAEWQRIKSDSSEAIPSELYLRKPQLAEKLARYKAAQADVKRAKRNLERTYVRAPYDAIIEGRDISLGSVVNPGNALGLLNSISVAEIRLPVADKDLRHLEKLGLDANVTLSANVAGKKQTWQGQIVRSEGVIDERSRMTYLVAQVTNPYQDNSKPLRFGSYLTAQITGKALDNAVAIPQHLVRDGKIRVLNDDLTLSFKTVNIIRDYEGMVIVDSGITEGAQLITSALEYPTEGMQLRIDAGLENNATTQLALKEE